MPGLAHVPRSSESVLAGEVLTGAVDHGPHSALVPAHDANTQLADDGIGYFVYDPRTGALLHRPAGVDGQAGDAS